jgi:hypothetical protein
MSNHVSRFYSAVSVLAGHGHIKQRLIEAFENNLSGIDAAELPIRVRQSFAELRSMMNQVAPLNGEGSTCASVRKMSVGEADVCAHKIIDLFGDMIRYGDDAQEVLPLHMEEPRRVPPFLVKSN